MVGAESEEVASGGCEDVTVVTGPTSVSGGVRKLSGAIKGHIRRAETGQKTDSPTGVFYHYSASNFRASAP